jgi:hypothetical protein
MKFRMNLEDRKLLAELFMEKNDVIFKCFTEYAKMDGDFSCLTVLFEDGFTETQALDCLIYYKVKHFVQNSYLQGSQKLELLFDIAIGKQKFYDTNFKVFNDSPALHNLDFEVNTNRSEINARAFKVLDLDINSYRNIPILQTIEELVMNAQLTAPLNVPENMKNLRVASSRLILEKSEKAIAISVIDNYGSLNFDKFFKKIETSLKIGRADSVNYKKGGASLGGSIVYGYSDFLLLGCEKNKKTRITSVVPYNISEANFNLIQKSISIIS